MACAGPPARDLSTITADDYPGLLRAPALLGPDRVWRQRVTAAWSDPSGERSQRGFDAVAQKQGDLLTLLGLSPMGSVGFVITLQDDVVSLQNQTNEPLPFPARCVLLDFQRAHYPWVARDGAALPDGEHRRELGGERVVERWQGGRLRERRFERLDGRPAGTIRVRMEWAETGPRAGWSAPHRVVIDNGWFGYELTVDTLEETLLPTG